MPTPGSGASKHALSSGYIELIVHLPRGSSFTIGSGVVGMVGVAPPPAAPIAGVGFIIAVGVVVGVIAELPAAPVAGVVGVIEVGVVVGTPAALPAAPVAGVTGVMPVVVGV